jgi:hypothetical protein
MSSFICIAETNTITNIFKYSVRRGFFNVADVGNNTKDRRSIATKLVNQ